MVMAIHDELDTLTRAFAVHSQGLQGVLAQIDDPPSPEAIRRLTQALADYHQGVSRLMLHMLGIFRGTVENQQTVLDASAVLGKSIEEMLTTYRDLHRRLKSLEEWRAAEEEEDAAVEARFQSWCAEREQERMASAKAMEKLDQELDELETSLLSLVHPQ